MAKVNLRVRYEGGQGVVKGLDPQDSLEKLISHSLEVLKLEEIDIDTIKILSGFPPKPLDLTDRDRSIESVGVKNGDTIIFHYLKASQFESDSTAHSSEVAALNSTSLTTSKLSSTVNSEGPTDAKRQKTNTDKGKMERKVVPADNSCLFTSINFCMSGELVSSENSAFMREIIATVVTSDTTKYNEAVLGRKNGDYGRWIQGKDAWGGAIEVQILAEYFQVEIVVIDTVSVSKTIFGENQNFPSRMVLIYDGIHYDPLYHRALDGSTRTTYSSKDDWIIDLALECAAEAKAAHNYTDVTGFTLKCLVCGKLMKGQSEAQKHAKESTHTNFSEV